MKRFFSVRIHPAGLAVCAIAFLLMDSHLVLAATGALFLHEGAHLMVMLMCGMRGCSIELTPFGGMADVRNFDAYPPWKRVLAAVSGAAASLIAAKCCLAYAPRTAFWHAFWEANLSLGVLNILPAWPLDGARALAALACCFGFEKAARRALAGVTVLLGIALTLLGLYGVWRGVINPGLLITGPYLCYAARAERISEKVRRLDGMDQKWKGTLLPAQVWTVRADRAETVFAALLGRGSRTGIQILLALDPDSGRIQHCWTEKEMMNHLFETGSN